MIRIENRLGTVGISTNFFAQLVSHAAAVRSLVSEVRYAVETVTGLRVDCVNVFVDAMKCE